jgi:peptidoglycan hydrolase-like protein with peptidoglycan-binding domain
MLSANANDFTFRLKETEVIERKHRLIQGETEMSSATSHPTLREGSSGDDVIYLQQLLNKKGRATIAVDGDFGSETKQMVEIYQRNHGLVVDGIVGPQTWSSLES